MEHLPTALFVLRTTVNRNLGMSPFECLYGRRPSTSLDLLFKEPSYDSDGVPLTHKDNIMAAHAWVRQNITKSVLRQRRAYLGKTQVYSPGEKVWLFTPRVASKGLKKFQKPWCGPFSIVRKVNPLVYEIQPPASWLRQRNEVVSIDRLKRFHIAEGENVDEYSVPPPVDADLSMKGDEFCESFTMSDEEDDEEGDGAAGANVVPERPPTPPQLEPPPFPDLPPPAPPAAVLPPLPEEAVNDVPQVAAPGRKRRATPDQVAKAEADRLTMDLRPRRGHTPPNTEPNTPLAAAKLLRDTLAASSPRPVAASSPRPVAMEEEEEGENFLQDSDSDPEPIRADEGRDQSFRSSPQKRRK